MNFHPALALYPASKMFIHFGIYTSKAIFYCKISWKSLNNVKVGCLRHWELCFPCILGLRFFWLVGLGFFLHKYTHLKYSISSKNLKRKQVLVDFPLGNDTYKITKFHQPRMLGRMKRTKFLFSQVFLLNVLFFPVPHLLFILLTNYEIRNLSTCLLQLFFQLHS